MDASSRCSLALSVLSSWRSRSMSACSASACECTDTYSPAAIDIAPATRPAMPAIRMFCWLAFAAATPSTRLAVETIPSLAPSTAARNQPTRWVRWRSRCNRRMVSSRSIEAQRSTHDGLARRRGFELQAQPFCQLEHALVAREHMAVDAAEALALGVLEQQPDQGGADAAALPGIAHGDAELAIPAVGVGRITRDADEVLVGGRTDHGDQRHARMRVDIDEMGDEIVRGFADGVHEAVETRFGRHAEDEFTFERGVGAAQRTDSVFGPVA